MASGKWHLGANDPSLKTQLREVLNEFYGFLSGGHKLLPGRGIDRLAKDRERFHKTQGSRWVQEPNYFEMKSAWRKRLGNI